MKKKTPTIDQDQNFQKSRREFVTNASIVLASAGVAATTRLQLVEDLAKKVLPHARASEATIPKRMIYVGVRSGIPVMGFATSKMFSQLDAPITPNVPFAGNEFVESENGLHFNPDSEPLRQLASNLLITQGIQNQGGHTSLFNWWQGGAGAGRTSPIITLSERNTSGAILPGVHFLSGGANSMRSVTHQNNGSPDLLTVHNSNFRDNFKRATLSLREPAAEKVLDASAKLSRRQALRIQQIVDNPLNTAADHQKAAQLLKVDYQSALDIADMDRNLRTGASAQYTNFGQALAHTLKAMSLNLVNSATVELSVGDWHGLRNMTATRRHWQQVSQKLVAAVDYMKRTPDIAGPPGTTLWDTTVIVFGTEFTRNDSVFDMDNGDGGSQGTLMLGKNIKGGFYGDITQRNVMIEGAMNPRILTYTGVDRVTGQPLPVGQRNSALQLYNTVNSIVDNPGVDRTQVITAYLRSS